MKKKQAKKNLKPRYKALPKEDVMHDFGQLGKWSESTLEANCEKEYYNEVEYDDMIVDMCNRCKIKAIERIAEKGYDDYHDEIHSKRGVVVKRAKLGAIYDALKELSELEQKRGKLDSDYGRYSKVMEKFKNRENAKILKRASNK